MSAIASVVAREILDSRGYPTLEADVTLSDGAFGRAAVPSGGSRGQHEAIEMRDADSRRYGGLGVTRAVAVVSEIIAPALRGVDAYDQIGLDSKILVLDGSDTKRRLGSNAVLGVSMAGARAAAASRRVPLYRHLGSAEALLLPVPMFNVLNGGAHADNNLEFEEFMISPIGARTYAEALRWGAECYHALRSTLRRKGYITAVGDEGGFAPDLSGNEEALDLLVEAIGEAGLSAGSDVVLGIDAATSALYDGEEYTFARSERRRLSSGEMVELWSRWVCDYPIWYIEDGMAEDDFEGWRVLTRTLGGDVVLAGDDVFVTDPDVISSAIGDEIGNSVLVKIDQIGTVTEALEAIAEARSGGYGTIVSHRSGETTDDFIADFAVASGAGVIKSGAPCRGERVAKYNQLLRIEDELGAAVRYAGAEGLRPQAMRSHKPHRGAAYD
jgi:enolase